ncbi:ankyrin repeat-containing domain protein [Thelonectria olida]|uniref:Ankyrin repeat-containing domain protein n=1 Tax=Thelonectria olida TaxID=1576542 RepID=A0A9P9ALR4_9HYPO|nr:ankyrin repeat-containing domain protein [Thelonectria olida]
MEFLERPVLLLKPRGYKYYILLHFDFAKAYEILTRMLPESFEQENLLRAQAITSQLDDASISITSMMEFLLYFAANNLSINHDHRRMDNAILHITECFLRMKVPLGQLSFSKEPTAQALAGRIFAAAIRRERIDLLKKLSNSGFDIGFWTRQQIPLRPDFELRLYSETGLQVLVTSALPIHVALFFSNVELSQFLLKHGADINNVTNVNNESTLSSMQAVASWTFDRGRGHKMEIVKFVLQHPEMSITEKQILDAFGTWDEGGVIDIHQAAALLLDHLRTINGPQELKFPTWVLMYAIRYSHQHWIDAIIPNWSPTAQSGEPYQPLKRHLAHSTPLLEAVYRGDRKICEMLLDAGTGQDLKLLLSLPALHVAASRGHVPILELLLARGAQINHCSATHSRYYSIGPRNFLKIEKNALSCAIRNYQDQAVKFLLQRQAGCDGDHLIDAFDCDDGNLKIINRLVEFGVHLPNRTGGGESTLAWAIRTHNNSAIQFILDTDSPRYDPEALLRAVDLGSDGPDNDDSEPEIDKTYLITLLLSQREQHTNEQEGNSESAFLESVALAVAVSLGDEALTSCLMAHGFCFSSDLCHLSEDHFSSPDLYLFDEEVKSLSFANHQDFIMEGCSLHGVAILSRRVDMFDLLTECQHWPSKADLFCAIRVGDALAFQKIIEFPHVISETREQWPSYLPLVIEQGMEAVADFFLGEGIDVNAISAPLYEFPFQKTALQAATTRGDLARMRSLIHLGSNVNAPAWTWKGATALQYAVMHGLIGAVKLLVDEGADCDAPAAAIGGRTALEAAGEHGRIDIIQYLLAVPTSTIGSAQHQYLRAVKRAEGEGHFAAAQLLRNHRAWTEEDDLIFESLVCREDD